MQARYASLGGAVAFYMMGLLPSASGAERPFVFSRGQHEYPIYRDYLDAWVDRPLFLDAAQRPETWTFITPASFSNDIAMANLYGLDGLSGLVVGVGQLDRYTQAVGIAEHATPTTMVYPEFGGASSSLFSHYSNALQTAINSGRSWRHDGKVVISSYNASSSTTEEWGGMLSSLRADLGNEFLFVADVRTSVYQLVRAYTRPPHNHEGWLAAFTNHLHSYLAVSDGIMFAGTGHFRDYSKARTYENHFAAEAYEMMIEAMQGVLSEYPDKLFGLSAAIGFFNPDSGLVQSEDGTKHLRQSFEIAARAHPDFIVLPEWDEVNENTCIRPTVCNSFSTQRILKYYMHQLRGETPAPNPDDDPNVPNLVLSYRQVVKIGQAAEFELLNIPDTDSEGTVHVMLNLLDEQGDSVISFPWETLPTHSLTDVTWRAATEAFPDTRVLVPELIVTNTVGQRLEFRGFQPIRVAATWMMNYKYVKQPVRDLLAPQHMLFERVVPSDGLAFHLELECDEPLASVEILENERPVWAYSQSPEFDPETHLVLRFRFTSLPLVSNLTGSIQVTGDVPLNFKSIPQASYYGGFSRDGNTIHITNQRVTQRPGNCFLAIPLDSIGDAELRVNLNTGTVPLGSFTQRLDRLLVDEAFARTFGYRTVIDVRRIHELAELPPAIRTNSVSGTVHVHPREPFPVYHLRAIALSGRTYRSPPIRPYHPEGARVPLPVFSDLGEHPVSTVSVHKEEIPNLIYRFSPDLGDALACSAGGIWRVEFGSGVARGHPFYNTRISPVGAPQATPAWTNLHGIPCLQFDGIGTYINFPHEAIPHGAFSLKFSIMRTAEEPQVLFRHHGSQLGSLSLLVDTNNYLVGQFLDQEVRTTWFRTELVVPLNEWVEIAAVYDLSTMTFRVGHASTNYPFTGRGLYYAPAVFGGHGTALEDYGHFQGYLSAFHIAHRAVDHWRHRRHVRVGGSGDGKTWDTATHDLQAAIEELAGLGGGEVWVAEGIYKPSGHPNGGTEDRQRHFSLRNRVAVYGGFPAEGNPDHTDRSPFLYTSILSGDIGMEGDPEDNVYHVFFHPQELETALDSTAVLDGVIVEGGQANGSSPHDSGGGMRNSFGEPLIRNSTFRDNVAADMGGGMFNGGTYEATILKNCVFHDNRATRGGGAFGGIHYNSTLCLNEAEEGGGIYAGTLHNSIIDMNTATVSGTNWAYSSGFHCLTPDPGGPGPLIVDRPQFIDPSARDLRLRYNSPCIHAGANQMWMLTAIDRDGSPRICGGTVDLGAYEWCDTDGDGLSDYEEVHVYGTDPDNPDTDGDGATDLEEIIAGTDPNDPESVFRITQIRPEDRYPKIVIRWLVAPGRNYRILHTTNLFSGIWVPITPDPENGHEITPSQPQEFFRLSVDFPASQ